MGTRNRGGNTATIETENTDVTTDDTNTSDAQATENKAKRETVDLSAVQVGGVSTREIKIGGTKFRNPDDPIARAVREHPQSSDDAPVFADLIVPDDAAQIKATMGKVRSVAQRAGIGASFSDDTPFRGEGVPEGHVFVSFYTRPKHARTSNPDRGAQTEQPTTEQADAHNEGVSFPE